MSTEDMMNALMKTRDFDRLCERHAADFVDERLMDYLTGLLHKYGASKRDLMVRADLEKGYAYQILRGIRTPSRDKLIQIALGLGCDCDETQQLLRLGGRNELYLRVKRDAAILFCLQRHYSLDDCQNFLESRKFSALRD